MSSTTLSPRATVRASSRRAALRAPLLIAALLLAACTKHEADAAGEEEKTPAVVGARTALAVQQPFSETIGAIGTVVARPGHVASLSAPGPTRVARVLVAVGAHVSRGQPLVQLDQTLFHATTQSAEARLAAAQRAYERAQRLSAEGIIPRKDVEQAEADLAAARADAATARRSSELAVLRSPIDGVVTRMSAVLGASVDANQPLVDVADPSALDIVFGVTPSEAARIRAGAPVTLEAGQHAGGERLGVGNVLDIAGTVDTTTRSVAVRARTPATRRPMRIGETVYGEIAIGVRANAIVVPADALVPEGEGFKVFVVDANGIAHARPVTVGARADSLAEITEGLKAGERVVTYGAYGVEDSAKVVPVEKALERPAAEEKEDENKSPEASK
jgi:RND family efflux transporter MFP subunit